ncbi:MAG: protein-ADP-ribose hydrolase [Eubacterium sp.]|jgi:O-acetyl-ADP-ribose deacetylase (regulator of RNase III)|uniref:protein-ADP-ribose hydrolase n=1 Tax=Eubacterium sp. F2 TaxID=3381348 RepID=UPI003908073F|nr:protein-ADP-ribose hydrolase [Eubacterium sp.]MCI2196483.1 protein-ADP-ribose hydrolase [Eubacterium sp.]
MTQTERRIWLIRALQQEMPEYAEVEIPEDEQGQRWLLRGLMNVRMPGPASDEFLKVQNAYLQQRTKEKGQVDPEGLTPSSLDPRLYIWQGDITRLAADAITNACNSKLLGCFQPNHNCIDNIEHTMAGVQMRLACYNMMRRQGHDERTGECKVTSGYNLPAKYVLHTVGPIVQGPLTARHRSQLASCYRSCLEAASAHSCRNAAFCCISTGVFMFPKKEAAEIAVTTVRKWLDDHPDAPLQKVIFNVFKDSDREIYEHLLG